jgi:hypothetical protein
MGFHAEKKTQKKREKSRGKLTDELKQKNVYLVNASDKNPFTTKDSPTTTSLFFIIIYLKCQYGTELNSSLQCCSPFCCKSSTPKEVRGWKLCVGTTI